MKKKVLVILGPTASGKSALAVKLAQKFNGEIISADSRQVYRNLNIGTGKITRKEMRGVPHHLLNIADPKKQFTASDFVREASKAIGMIYHTGSIPIVVGGTGFYIDALTGLTNFPDVPPNKKLRDRLNRKSTSKLFKILQKKDPRRARAIDPNNKVRLIRALEIVAALGKVPLCQHATLTPYKFTYVGLKPDNLDEKIYKRLLERLEPMIREAKKLIRLKAINYKRMYELGLEYRYIGMYLQNKISKKEMVEKLNIAIRQYAKRQMTWFSAKAGGSASPEGGKRRERNKKIRWFTLSAVEGFKPEEYKKVEKYLETKI